MVLFSCPTTRKASLPTSLFAYRVAYSSATRKPCEFSWGHIQIFRTVPTAHTLVRWEDENAFASIVQARPDPIFGRPVHQRVAPSITARYFSSCPSDSTSRWTPCPPVAFMAELERRFPLGRFHRFRFRARLDSPYSFSPASEALPPLLDMAPLIRAPVGLEPT